MFECSNVLTFAGFSFVRSVKCEIDWFFFGSTVVTLKQQTSASFLLWFW